MVFHNIIINPEIAASALKNDEADLFLIWLLSKKIDKSNSGIIDLSEIINIADKVLGIKSNYIYKKIKFGENKYWRKPFGIRGHKKICLLSMNNVIDRLKPDLARTKAFIIPSHVFKFDNFKLGKNFLISLVAARYEDYRPISLDSLIKNTGQSESTIRNAIKECVHVKVKSNYEIIFVSESKLEANKLLQSFDTPWSFRIIQNGNCYNVIKQLPNSYIISEFDRQPIRCRPDRLKKIDKITFANLTQQKYYIKNEKIELSESSIVSFNLA